MPIADALEAYTLAHPQEVLVVHAQIAGEPDQIMVFKGYSSSLMRPTAFDLDIPVLPEGATILAIDRLQAPYDPDCPIYLEQNITWADFQQRFL